MNATRILARCIAQCSRHRDGRGAWQSQRATAAALGGSAIDLRCAAAAARLGQFIRDFKGAA